jgi:hypothetical protein
MRDIADINQLARAFVYAVRNSKLIFKAVRKIGSHNPLAFSSNPTKEGAL